ncbi:MAG: class I SAM-dependent methyltransferase [Pseudomonadota bacterium]
MLRVLQEKNQIAASRRSLIDQGRSVLESKLSGFLRKLRIRRELPVGDFVKSWDVALTLDFIEGHLAKSAQVLDLGAYCSEVPVALARMGFTGVHGVDLNPAVADMPEAHRVNYRVGDFMQTPFASSSFSAITSISVIEHGYDPDRLFAEASRLLEPGGYFIASFDYWPEKIDTGNTCFFGLSWRIFSRADVEEMLEVAKKFGLEAAGDMHSHTKDRAIHCMGFDYTFGWLVLRKSR